MSLDAFILVRVLASLIVLFLDVKNVKGWANLGPKKSQPPLEGKIFIVHPFSWAAVWRGGGANENTGAMSVGFLSIRILRLRLTCFQFNFTTFFYCESSPGLGFL
jgi:hypothetical protein